MELDSTAMTFLDQEAQPASLSWRASAGRSPASARPWVRVRAILFAWRKFGHDYTRLDHWLRVKFPSSPRGPSGGDFHRADPNRGRFRDFIKSSLINLVI